MRDVWKEKYILSPSLICLDMCNLEQQVYELEREGIRMLHIDILDGVFSPSMPLGLETVRQLRSITNLEFDCHVMTQNPKYYVEELLDIGVQQINVQIETIPHVDEMLNMIHRAGVRAGLALKPATPLTDLEYVLEKCDCVLLMLINPGYASVKGESQVPYAERKITELNSMINERKLETLVELDGRVSRENICQFAGSRANIFVAGSTCISRQDIAASVLQLRNFIEKHLIQTGR